MISSQRLLLIVILLNVVMGIALSAYRGDTLDVNSLNFDRCTLEEETNNIMDEDEYSGIKNTQVQTEPTVVNSISLTAMIWNTAKCTAEPLPFTPDQFTTSIEQLVAMILLMFRWLMYFLVSLEIYLLFKNKKNT